MENTTVIIKKAGGYKIMATGCLVKFLRDFPSISNTLFPRAITMVANIFVNILQIVFLNLDATMKFKVLHEQSLTTRQIHLQE